MRNQTSDLLDSILEHQSAESKGSEVQFLVGTQNFLLVPQSRQDEKHLSLKMK